MSDSALDSYIATIDPAFASAAVMLDRAIMTACPELESKISYRMLTYALDGDFHYWICAVDVHKKPFHVRFLFGALLDDPRHVLRSGSSHLANLDFATQEEIDPRVVSDFVRDAVSRLGEFKTSLGTS